MTTVRNERLPALLMACCAIVALGACGGETDPAGAGSATPVYNEQTGRLEELLSDRDGDGTTDTRAFMEGTKVVRIDIDRDNDGSVDRREYYAAVGGADNNIERAEEMAGAGDLVVRQEFYVDGALVRVEEDASLDGQVDKWETYREGRLVQVDLDLLGKGTPTRRLIYGADGGVDRMEADPEGDGVFDPIVPDTPQ